VFGDILAQTQHPHSEASVADVRSGLSQVAR
jgi:hypothetical protein